MQRGRGRRRKLFSCAIVAVFATTIVMCADTLHLTKAPDKFIYDWKVSLLSTRVVEQRKDIVLVYIDDQTLEDYFYRSPVDRALLATLIREIDAASPKVVGLDFVFDRQSEPQRDEALITAINAMQTPIVISATDGQERNIGKKQIAWQDQYLSRLKRVQRASPFLGSEDSSYFLGDDVVRSMEPLALDSPTKKPFAFALAEFAGVMKHPQSRIIDWLLAGPSGLEPFQTFVVPPHIRVNENLNERTVLPADFIPFLKNKIVIIGADMSGLDRHRVPTTVATNLDVAGPYIQAQILAQLIDNRQIRRVTVYTEVSIVLMAALVLLLVMEIYKHKHMEFLCETIIMAMIFVLGVVMFWGARLIFPSSSLLMVWLLVAGFGEFGTKFVGPLVKRL